jgi:hypothetical protein
MLSLRVMELQTSASMGTEQPVLVLGPNTHEDRIGALNRERRKRALGDAKTIALAEFARRRRKLGSLTRDQEIALEKLLMTAVNKVANLAAEALEALPSVPAIRA